MQQLMDRQGSVVDGSTADGRPQILFAHANGYPPGSYQRLLEQLNTYGQVLTVEHRPLWQPAPIPRFLPWRVYAEDLINTLARSKAGPLWLVGHSMGAITGMLAAQQAPRHFKGVIALDPVLLPRSVLLAGSVMMRFLRREMTITQRALNRPHRFDDHQAAFDFYRSKRPFKNIDDEVLWHYVRAGHAAAADGSVALRWAGAWEACVYRSAPFMLSRLRQFKLPMLGIAGQDSDVLTSATLKAWQQAMPSLDLHVVPGGHLVPLEASSVCADLAIDFIERHDRSKPLNL